MVEVLIIGGGIAGCSTAYYLAAAGVEVTLLDRHDLNTQASGSNAGSLHAQIQHEPFLEHGAAWARQFAPALRFYMHSIELWRDASRLLGSDLEVSLDGGLLVAATAAELAQVEAKAAIERAAGLPVEILDAAELARRAPYIAGNMAGAGFCPLEGKANPLAAAPAYAAAAHRHGASIRRRQRVDAITAERDGFEVATSAGVLRARRVVNAGGIDVATVARMLGVRLDVASWPIQLSVTEPAEPLIPHLIYSASDMLTLKQNRAGTVLIGGGWPAMPDEGGRPRVSGPSLTANLGAALRVVPALRRLRLVRSWAAAVNGNASWKPLLGAVPGIPGFFINYVPWMGFSGGPAGAEIVASLVQGREPPVDFDLRPFMLD